MKRRVAFPSQVPLVQQPSDPQARPGILAFPARIWDEDLGPGEYEPNLLEFPRYSQEMPQGPPRTPTWVVALTIGVALGICATAASIMVPGLLGHVSSDVLVAGIIILAGCLAGLGMMERRRGRHL